MKSIFSRVGKGKNSKLLYFIREYSRRLVPPIFCRMMRGSMLKKLEHRQDYPELLKRIDYYCGIDDPGTLPKKSFRCDQYPRHHCHKVYKLDTYAVLRYFPRGLRWRFAGGDNITEYCLPTVVKSRPINCGSSNDVLLKLNRIRHYIFVNDKLSWEEKKDMAVFRGKCARKPLRLRFLNLFADSAMVDAGCNDRPDGVPEKCYVENTSIREQLKYKFVLCLEGNDVASNLKWVMSSNSLAVMPRPKYETWYMEGLLEPGVHYVEIRDDYSDLEEKMRYYISHPEDAKRIVKSANRWAAMFRDKKIEKQLQIAVMQRYFERTGQL